MGTGYAPYQEAAIKGQARVSMMQRLGQIFAGAGQGIAASQNAQNPFEAGALGFAGSFGASNAAKQAAEAYAMKKIEAERVNEQRQLERINIESQIKAREKPAPPAKPTKDEEAARILGRPLTDVEKQKLAGVYIAPKAGPKPAKPPRMREAVAGRIDLINQADTTNPEHRARLQSIIANPATPEEKAAALKRLEITPGYYRR